MAQFLFKIRERKLSFNVIVRKSRKYTVDELDLNKDINYMSKKNKRIKLRKI